MLCSECRRIFENQHHLPMNYHDDTRPFNCLVGKMLSNQKGLEEGAAQKCQLCLPLWNLILEQVEEGLMALGSDILTIYSFHTLFYNNFLYIPYRVFGKGPHRFPDLESTVILWPQAGSEVAQSPASAVEPQKLLKAEGTGSDPLLIPRWPQIFKWIHECEHEHTRCPKLSVSEASTWYPTRLLEVPASGNSVKLVITSIEKPSSAYVALSHRWGTGLVVTLTAENMEEFLNGIQITSLPKTFQDAITVARELSVKYLWIDSLCILQSGEGAADDWNGESSTMHRVYGNAFCNIAATSAPNSGTGLFLDHPAEVDPPATVSLNFKSRKNVEYRGNYTVINSNLWATVISRSPLMRRAWVFQERMLAPRVLHFASSQVFWECCTKQACETFPSGLPEFSQAQLDRIYRPTTHDEVHHYQDHHDIWASIVEDYSRCSLTMEEDKLVALSGVAQRISEFHKKSDYIAGNWREDFPFCLIWYSEPRLDARSFRPTNYRAPSWSWASYEGVVIFAAGPFDNMGCEVLDISLSPASPGITGRVESGSITLIGHLISSHWVPDDSDMYERFTVQGNGDIEGFWLPDERETLDDRDPDTVRFFCLAIHGGMALSGESFLMGITLVRTEEGEGGKQQYRRMGYFSVMGTKKVDAIMGAERREVVIV